MWSWGWESWPQTVSQLASQSHMFYISGRKPIDKNISLSHWFVIDYCFLVTQWLMTTLFFGPEAHMSYSLTPCTFFPLQLSTIIKLAWIQFRHLHLEALWSPSSLFTELFCLVSHSPSYRTFGNPICQARLDSGNINWHSHYGEQCGDFSKN